MKNYKVEMVTKIKNDTHAEDIIVTAENKEQAMQIATEKLPNYVTCINWITETTLSTTDENYIAIVNALAEMQI